MKVQISKRMKKLILLLAVIPLMFTGQYAHAQSNYDWLAPQRIEIELRQAEDTRIPVYSPDWNFLLRMDDRLNAMVENNLSQIKYAYQSLMNITLINKYNIPRLEDYKKNVYGWVTTPAAESLDFTQQANVNLICKVINGYLSDKPVKDELDILTKINSELSLLKSRNPESFTNSQRYKELMSVIAQLSDCSNNDIRQLALQHALF